MDSGPLFPYILNIIRGREELDLERLKADTAESDKEYTHPLHGYASALFIVVQYNEFGLDAIDVLLDAGFDINAQNTSDETPLLLALKKGLMDKAFHLIQRGADINIVSKEGNAIHHAITGGYITILEYLLNNGVDVNYFNRTVDPPINSAIKGKHWNLVEYLLNQTIQPCLLNSTDKKLLPSPPLNVAVVAVQDVADLPRIVQLLDAGADVNGLDDKHMSPLAWALAVNQRDELVTLLLERGAQPSDVEGNDEIFYACHNCYPEAVRVLLERGAKVDKLYGEAKNTLVHSALSGYQASVVHRLFPNLQQVQLVTAARRNEVLQVLSEAGADFNQMNGLGKSPIMSPCPLTTFQLLETCGADLTARFNGNNLLLTLLTLESVPTNVIEYILSKNLFDVNERSVRGNTAIHMAAALAKKSDFFSVFNGESRSVKLVQLLLQHNPDLNITNINDGQTALMIAIDFQSISAAKLLFTIPCDMSIKDLRGNNILHFICKADQHAEFFLLLFTRSVPATIIRELQMDSNIAGETPIDVAKKSGNEGVARLLEGDIMGAAKFGVSVFNFMALHPAKQAKYRRGFIPHTADISNYDFNTGQTSVICQFPQETITSILVQITVEDLLSFSMVCRQFKKWSSHSSTWTEIFKRTYGRECSRQNVKKELITKRRAEQFMKKGEFIANTIQANPEKERSDSYYSSMNGGGVLCMDFDTEFELLAVGTQSGNIVFIDVRHSVVAKVISLPQEVEQANRPIAGIKLMAADRTVIYKTLGSILTVKNYETNEEIVLSKKCDIKFEVNRNFALFSNDRDIILADWRTGEVLWTHQDGETKPSVVYLTDELAVTVSFGDRRVRFWNLVTLTPVTESKIQIAPRAFWSSAHYLLLASAQGFECFDIVTGKTIYSRTSAHTGQQTRCIALDEISGNLVTVAGAELFVWDLPTGLQKTRLSEQDYHADALKWNKNAWQYLCVAVKGNFVFAGLQGNRCAIEVYDVSKPVKEQLVYKIPLRTAPTNIILKENYLIIGLLNETVKIVSFNIPEDK